MEQQMQFNFENSIRGYHVYKSIWTYEISEKLRCDREENNPNDKSAVKLMEIKNNV
jgi:isopropylmalate/homocitrate/citramalate synthase